MRGRKIAEPGAEMTGQEGRYLAARGRPWRVLAALAATFGLMSLRCGSLLGLGDFCDGNDAGPKPCPSSGAGASSSGGQGTSCSGPQDCAAPAHECVEATCLAGKCRTTNTLQGTPVTNQIAGDCQTVVCDGNGSTMSEADDMDTPKPKSACVSGTCKNGAPGMSDVATGTGCAEGAKGKECNGKGACVECLSTKECASMVCSPQGSCVPPSCMDGVQNGMETDVDCGGPACPKCSYDKTCKAPSDCLSATCTMDHCACSASMATCPSGCADLTSDPKNCAECGHDCLGGTCVASACQPVTLASNLTFPQGIAVDDASAYWVDGADNTVMKVSIAGGTPTMLVAGQNNPQCIAVDATSVYWTNYASGTVGQGSVMKAPIGGGTAVAVATGQNGPQGIAVDKLNVYWVNSDGTVMQAPIGLGNPITVASGQLGPAGVAVDVGNVYWVSGSGIAKAPIGGGTTVPLYSGQIYALGIAVDATSVYWTDGAISGSVMKAPTGGGSPTQLASGQYAPGGIAVDLTTVYWTTQAVAGAIWKSPIGHEADSTIATGQPSPMYLASGAKSVFWTTGPAVVMVAK